MIILIVGKSGSGKDWLADKLKGSLTGSRILRRPTTRPKREGMEESYSFISGEEFTCGVESGSIVAITDFRGWHYGFFSSIRDQVESDIVFIGTCDIESAYKVKEIVEDIAIIHVHAPRIVRSKRATEREKFPDYEEVARRMTSEIAQYNEFKSFSKENCIHYTNHGMFEKRRLKKLIKQIGERL